MARRSAPTKAHQSEASPADQAFGAAKAFIEHLAMVAASARQYQPRQDEPDAWKDVAFDYANAFIAWYGLTHLLTPAVCTQARRVYPPDAASIKLVAGNRAAPVVPAMPEGVVDLLAAFRVVELDATPYPTVIEAVADELGVYFRNAVYADRRHPLEPDTERVANEAKDRATARQVAQGKPAEPSGWGADYAELMTQETRAAVWARLGIKTYGDGQDLMMNEWKAQDPARGESALSRLRCGSIDFGDLRIQLVREAEAVMAAAVDPGAFDRVAERAAAKAVEAMTARDDDGTAAASLPKLGPRDRKAWQASLVFGMTQDKIADALNEQYPGEHWTQPRVSEAIKRAKAHAEASGLADKITPLRSQAPARTLDPAVADEGQRTDGRAKYLREKMQQMAKEE